MDSPDVVRDGHDVPVASRLASLTRRQVVTLLWRNGDGVVAEWVGGDEEVNTTTPTSSWAGWGPSGNSPASHEVVRHDDVSLLGPVGPGRVATSVEGPRTLDDDEEAMLLLAVHGPPRQQGRVGRAHLGLAGIQPGLKLDVVLVELLEESVGDGVHGREGRVGLLGGSCVLGVAVADDDGVDLGTRGSNVPSIHDGRAWTVTYNDRVALRTSGVVRGVGLRVADDDGLALSANGIDGRGILAVAMAYDDWVALGTNAVGGGRLLAVPMAYDDWVALSTGDHVFVTETTADGLATTVADYNRVALRASGHGDLERSRASHDDAGG